jgi:Uma2 family endonuclease
MSTTPATARPSRHPDEPEGDPYYLGWRYVEVTRPDGTIEVDQIPLTPEDVLHPEVGDFIVNSHGHNEDCRYLKSLMRARLAGDPSAVVLSDCRIDWGVPGVRPLGPDIAVFFGVRRERSWNTFSVAEEGARPALAIEITSPATWENDVGIKVDYYHRAGIPLYVIVLTDEAKDERRLRLIGYRHAPGGYEPLEPDTRGRLWLEPIGLWLGVAASGSPASIPRVTSRSAITRRSAGRGPRPRPAPRRGARPRRGRGAGRRRGAGPR